MNYRRSRRFWIRPVRTSAWWARYRVGQFCFLNCCFITVKCRKYRSRVCTYCLTHEIACHLAFSSVLVWTVENAAKTVVWTRIDRCVFDDTDNGYLWKRISVDGPKWAQLLTVYISKGKQCYMKPLKYKLKRTRQLNKENTRIMCGRAFRPHPGN